MTFNTKEVFYSYLTYDTSNFRRWRIPKDGLKSSSSGIYIIRGSIL
jgi:hypothetical protein